MKRILRIVVVAGLMVQIPVVMVHAADLDAPLYVENAPEFVPVEIGTGWYLRGDVSYSVATSHGTFSARNYNTVTGSYGDSMVGVNELDANFGFGGGIGYTFNRWLRVDVTADRFSGNFDGNRSDGVPCVSPLTDINYTGTNCRYADSTSYNAVSLLANAYVDMGTYAGFTPYIGGGVGYSVINWDPMNSTAYCQNGVGACPAVAAGNSSHPDESDWRFTYALMAGVAVDITRNMKLDLGYRYRQIASGSMYSWDTADATAGAVGTQGSDGGLSTHEVKLGLRYQIW